MIQVLKEKFYVISNVSETCFEGGEFVENNILKAKRFDTYLQALDYKTGYEDKLNRFQMYYIIPVTLTTTIDTE